VVDKQHLVVMSFETADAQKDPDKGKKIYPYTVSEVKCIGNNWWILVYLVEGPNKKVQIFQLIIQENCKQPEPDIGGPYFILKDGYLSGTTYTPPDKGYLFNGTNFAVTAFPEVVAPVSSLKQFKIRTIITNNLDENVDVHFFEIVPKPWVSLLQWNFVNCKLGPLSSCELVTEWRCNQVVKGAVYGYKFTGYPQSAITLTNTIESLRVSGEQLNVNNTITCLDYKEDVSGTITFSEASESTSITAYPVSETSKRDSEEENFEE